MKGIEGKPSCIEANTFLSQQTFKYLLKNRYISMEKSMEEQSLELSDLPDQVYSFTIMNS